MTDDTQQGIYWELHFILKAGWTIHKQDDGFRVAPPKDGLGDLVLVEEVWRIAQFVAYRPFVSITYNTVDGYILESRRENGTGFRIYFEGEPSELPDHRPESV